MDDLFQFIFYFGWSTLVNSQQRNQNGGEESHHSKIPATTTLVCTYKPTRRRAERKGRGKRFIIRRLEEERREVRGGRYRYALAGRGAEKAPDCVDQVKASLEAIFIILEKS